MVYVLRNAAVLVALFLSFHVKADIYEGVPFEAPKVDTSKVITQVYPNVSSAIGTEYQGLAAFCQTFLGGNYGNGSFTHVANLNDDGISASGICYFDNGGNGNAAVTYGTSDNKSCPPNTKPSYEYPVDIDNDGEIDRCYDPSLLELNDSCPTHGTLFPSGSNTAQNMCMILPDGSQCHVSKRSDSYAIDEGSCYGNELPVFDDSGEPQTDQDGCKTYSDALGNSSTSCPADPADHCSSGPVINGEARYQCEAGCGQDSTGAFVCFNQDDSGDNLPPFEPDPFTPDNPDTNNDGVSDTKDTNKMLQGVQNLINDSKTATQEMSHNLGQKLDAIKANGDIIKTFGAGIGEINGGIGAINKKLEKEDKKTTYTTTAQTPDKTKMDELFSEQKLNQLKEDITDKKTEIQNEINQIRAEFSGLINIPVPSANGYQSRMLDLTMTSVDLSLSRLDYLWGLLAAPIMLAATFMAAMILLGRYF